MVSRYALSHSKLIMRASPGNSSLSLLFEVTKQFLVLLRLFLYLLFIIIEVIQRVWSNLPWHEHVSLLLLLLKLRCHIRKVSVQIILSLTRMLRLLYHHHYTLIAWILNRILLLLLVFLLLFILSAGIRLLLHHHVLIAKYLLLSVILKMSMIAATIQMLELLLGRPLLLECFC